MAKKAWMDRYFEAVKRKQRFAEPIADAVLNQSEPNSDLLNQYREAHDALMAIVNEPVATEAA